MKNHFLKILLFSISVFQLEIISFTQQNEKIWFDGLGRSYFSRDNERFIFTSSFGTDIYLAIKTPERFEYETLNIRKPIIKPRSL